MKKIFLLFLFISVILLVVQVHCEKENNGQVELNKEEKRSSNKNIPTKDTIQATQRMENQQIVKGENINILYLGLDLCKERKITENGVRMDAILVCNIDLKTLKVTMISIPRDTIVKMPYDNYLDKINHSLGYNNQTSESTFEKAVKTVSHFLGDIKIDYYLATDMQAVKDIIDTLGGIDINIETEVRMCGRLLSTGYQHINGQEVLDYSRWRHTHNGDLDREFRQQQVLMAIFSKLKNLKLTELLSIFKKIRTIDGIFFNIKEGQLAELIPVALKLDSNKFQSYQVPVFTLFREGIYYFGVMKEKFKPILLDTFGEKALESFENNYCKITYSDFSEVNDFEFSDGYLP